MHISCQPGKGMDIQGALAGYASHPQATRGRRITEPPAPTRTDYQRDRDRIVHSSAFRRLVYKTQVFVNHEGDMFRTRLTHSIEVAQLGRSIARPLGLCEDLTEAIALAHDLGHTPFGHAGQDALNECMAAYGGFEHNIQSLRVVDKLEQRYPQFDGLNLCFETREGILKHCSLERAAQLGEVGERFLSKHQPSLEAQLINLADEIAYNAHDIDDGVRSGLLRLDQVMTVPLFAHWAQDTLREYPHLQGKRLLYEAIRRMLSAQVYDVLDATRAQLARYQPRSVQDVVNAPEVMVQFSPAMREQSRVLKKFLMQHLYRHPQVMATMNHAQQVVHDLFRLYSEKPERATAAVAAEPTPRHIADYIAGMTDRFAISEHIRYTGKHLFVAEGGLYAAAQGNSA